MRRSRLPRRRPIFPAIGLGESDRPVETIERQFGFAPSDAPALEWFLKYLADSSAPHEVQGQGFDRKGAREYGIERQVVSLIAGVEMAGNHSNSCHDCATRTCPRINSSHILAFDWRNNPTGIERSIDNCKLQPVSSFSYHFPYHSYSAPKWMNLDSSGIT